VLYAIVPVGSFGCWLRSCAVPDAILRLFGGEDPQRSTGKVAVSGHPCGMPLDILSRPQAHQQLQRPDNSNEPSCPHPDSSIVDANLVLVVWLHDTYCEVDVPVASGANGEVRAMNRDRTPLANWLLHETAYNSPVPLHETVYSSSVPLHENTRILDMFVSAAANLGLLAVLDSETPLPIASVSRSVCATVCTICTVRDSFRPPTHVLNGGSDVVPKSSNLISISMRRKTTTLFRRERCLIEGPALGSANL
jgi:hypothetical protein